MDWNRKNVSGRTRQGHQKTKTSLYLLSVVMSAVYLMDEIITIANHGKGLVPIIDDARICDRCKSDCIRRCAPRKSPNAIFAKVSKIENEDVRFCK
jgi:hypothetical protein